MIRAALAALLLAAATPEGYEASAPVTLQGDGPFYRLSLPMPVVLAAHAPDLHDLRVLNGRGEAVPFALIRAQPRTERTERSQAVPWFPLFAADTSADALRQIRVERRSDGTIVSVLDGDGAGPQKRRGYLLDLSATKEPARKLTLDWDPSVGGFQQLSVEASDDLQSWQPWVTSAQLARLDFNGQHVERRSLDLPGARAAYLRLTWSQPAEAPALTAAMLTTGSQADRPAVMVWSDPAPPSRIEAGRLEWDLPRPVAVEQVRIALPQVNVVAPVALSVRTDESVPAEWRQAARAVLYRLQVAGTEWHQEDLALFAGPVRALRLEPDARAGLGDGVPSLSVGVTAEELLFLARGPGPFTLAVGRDDAAPADLAPATLVPGYGTDRAPPIGAATLGPLGGAAPAGGVVPAGGAWQGILLWAVLLLGVGAIGLMAIRLLRQTRG